jgi:hypothetical protein
VASLQPVWPSTLTLLTRARDGDRSALEELFGRHLSSLRRWARGRLPLWARDLGDTQDLVQESARALERRLKHYAKIGLLVLDEIGFLAFDNRNADLLFQVISRRYEKKSTVLTTNLAFSGWPTIFPNATCATALIDRVVHHADVIAIEGESYRARDAEAQAKERRSRRKEKPESEPAA